MFRARRWLEPGTANAQHPEKKGRAISKLVVESPPGQGSTPGKNLALNSQLGTFESRNS